MSRNPEYLKKPKKPCKTAETLFQAPNVVKEAKLAYDKFRLRLDVD